MRAHAVIGANYGDEGKGLITDYICARKGAGVVVRFNGGAQAGHTVVSPDGRRHVFSHFGAGTFAGAATVLSRFFICNPILFNQEWAKLRDKPVVHVSPECLVTLPFDMLINQAIEKARGRDVHGSCGVGINETVHRCTNYPTFYTTVGALRGYCEEPDDLRELLWTILEEYVPLRLAELNLPPETSSTWRQYVNPFVVDVNYFYQRLQEIGPEQFLLKGRDLVVFEGAQGLLLDQDNKEEFPHVTRSSTGIKNVLTLCDELGIDELTATYVTRLYLTRHGAGPLKGELSDHPYGAKDLTNVRHPFQGDLRYALLDYDALRARVRKDYLSAVTFKVSVNPGLAITHLDEVKSGCYDMVRDITRSGITPTASRQKSLLLSDGETRNDVRLW